MILLAFLLQPDEHSFFVPENDGLFFEKVIKVLDVGPLRQPSLDIWLEDAA